MSKKGHGAYQGKHWMQDPANKARMMAMVKQMQIGAKRARKAGTYGKNSTPSRKLATIAKEIISAKVKREPYKKNVVGKQKTVVVDGIRFIINKDEIRIELEND